MPGQARQTSYASYDDDRSIYSQDSSDHSTIGDAENPPAATSDEHPGVSETTPEKAQPLHDDDSNIETDLSSMLTNLKDKIEEILARAADRALSLESRHDEDSNDAKLSYLKERLAETKKSLAHEIDRKGIYKNRGKELTEKNESLTEAMNDLSSKVDTLTAEKKAAKAKAMEIFG